MALVIWLFLKKSKIWLNNKISVSLPYGDFYVLQHHIFNEFVGKIGAF